MSKKDNNNVPASTTTLLGGETITITYLDGTTETVQVRQLSIKQLGAYAESFEDSEKCLELFTGLTPDQAARLSTPSAIDILEKGHALNADFLGRLLATKTNVRKKLIPNYDELLGKVISSHLPSTAPVSPSASASASTP